MGPGLLSVAVKHIEPHQSPYLDLVPVLASKGVHSLLLKTLLALRKALVPEILSDCGLRNLCCPPSHRISHNVRQLSSPTQERGNSLSDSHDCDVLRSRGRLLR